MTTREEFLGRVRGEVRRAGALFPAEPAPRPARPIEAAELVRREMAERWPQALERFRQEFERVAGVFHRVTTLADVPATVLAIAKQKAATRLVTWDPGTLGFDLGVSLGSQGFEVVAAGEAGDPERRRHREEMASGQIGITGVDAAIAETGTLVLLSGRGRPRSTSLLPETHIAVFDRSRLVESLEQVGLLLEAWHLAPARSMSGAVINFITGPSRTADIELTLTRGVHGPKDVHAIFVEQP